MNKVNYTEDQVKTIKKMYLELGNDGLGEIASTVDKSVTSVRAKLIHEGVYKAAEKVSKVKNDGPSKKELLNKLQEIVGFDTSGLANATKPALANLIKKLG